MKKFFVLLGLLLAGSILWTDYGDVAVAGHGSGGYGCAGEAGCAGRARRVRLFRHRSRRAGCYGAQAGCDGYYGAQVIPQSGCDGAYGEGAQAIDRDRSPPVAPAPDPLPPEPEA